MRILVFGAGVLGSLYAAKLHRAGHSVALLARGERLAALATGGVQLEHALSGKKDMVRVPLVEKLDERTAYDLILVLVRADQLDSAAHTLGKHQASQNLLFMVNNPTGHASVASAVGADRLMLGFAGAGGYRDGDLVKYVVLPGLLQLTTIGEPDGSETVRLTQARKAFRSAGFPVALNRTMDAWYRYHAAWVTPIAYAIYKARASDTFLAQEPKLLGEMLAAIRELWASLSKLGLEITPPNLRLIQKLPDRILVPIVARALSGRFADTAAYRHAEAAPAEMGLLASELTEIVRRAAIPTPSWERLFRGGESVRISLATRGESR